MSTRILEVLKSRVEEWGVRSTSPRRGILEAISEQRAPFCPEDLVEQVPGVGRATVYRTVKLLLSMSLLCRIGPPGRGARYVVSLPGDYHHLVCISCGAVQELADGPIEQLVTRLARRAHYRPQGHLLEIYGRCHECG